MESGHDWKAINAAQTFGARAVCASNCAERAPVRELTAAWLAVVMWADRSSSVDMGHAASSSNATAESRAGSSPLAHLPDVLIQSVCHSLSAREILSVARTSKQLMHACDGPAAWMHSPLAVSFEMLRVTPSLPSRSCLYARAPLSLRAPSSFPSDRRVLDSEFLGGPPRIHTMDFTGLSNPAQWLPYLLHPSCAAIRRLQIYSLDKCGEVSSPSLQSICNLAQLHTLIVYPNHASVDSVEWGVLAEMPRLTSLEIGSADRFEDNWLLPSIVECSGLRELRLVKFDQPAIELFEAIAALPQLRLLWFGRGCTNVDSVLHLPSRFRAACARMHALEELQFSASQMLRQAIPFLDECKSLRSLSLQRDINMVGQEAAAVFCSPQLAALLAVLPQCVFSLRVVVHSLVTKELAATQVASFRQMFDAVCAIERSNQARANAEPPPADVSARLRTIIELPTFR